MVIIKSDLRDIIMAFDLSRKVFNRIRLNFVFALMYNCIGVPAAAGLFLPLFHMQLPPVYGGFAMAMSSVSVVLSSLALRFYQPPSIQLGSNTSQRFESNVNFRNRRYNSNYTECEEDAFDDLHGLELHETNNAIHLKSSIHPRSIIQGRNKS